MNAVLKNQVLNHEYNLYRHEFTYRIVICVVHVSIRIEFQYQDGSSEPNRSMTPLSG